MNTLRQYWHRSSAARFVAIGGACALLYFAICLVLSDVGNFSPFYASLSAYAVCFVIGYSSQRRIAFRSTASHRVTLTRYFIWHAFGATAISTAVEIAARSLALTPLAAALVSTVLCGAVSFCISSRWVFSDSRA